MTVRQVISVFEHHNIDENAWSKRWKGSSKGNQVRLRENLDLLENWGFDGAARKKITFRTWAVSLVKRETVKKKLVWLVDDLGFDRKGVVKIVSGYPAYLGHSLENNIIPFMERLLRAGLSRERLRRVLVKYPHVLGRRRKFDSSLEYFRTRCGFSEGDYLRAVERVPQILGYSIERKIKPTFDHFLGIGLDATQVSLLIKQHPGIFTLSLAKNIIPMEKSFQELGLALEEIARILRQTPQLWSRDFQSTVLDKIDWLENELGLSRLDAKSLLAKWPSAFNARVETWEGLRQCILSYGLEGEDVSSFFIEHPNVVGMSCGTLKEKIDFGKHVLRKDVREILGCRKYLTSSLERVIKVRHAFLEEQGYDLGGKPISFLVESANRFCQIFPEFRPCHK